MTTSVASGALSHERDRRSWLWRDPVVLATGSFIALLALMAIFAPLLAPDNPNYANILAVNQGPSAAHLLGTDSFGRDLLSRLIYGARLSLLGPTLIIAIATSVGTLLAVSCAWFGGWFDQVVSRVADILFAFPGLIFAMLAVAMFGPGLVAPVIALSIAYTPYLMRVIRAEALRQRNLPFVAACYVGGLPSRTIMWRHILPNIMPLLVVQATLSFGYALVDMAAVSYLGLGVQPPTAEWGLMVSTGQSAILAGHPQESLFAGIMIILTVVCFNLLGDRLASHRAERPS
ncbi:MAG TPA: ABC transporter permease [Acidimicrobiales bacterium]|nr:ABC transporter permease [Acidimicrobiales bacterium]